MDGNLVYPGSQFLGENNADFNINPIRSSITLCPQLSNTTVIFQWRRLGCEYFSIQILVLPSASCISYVQTIANRAGVFEWAIQGCWKYWSSVLLFLTLALDVQTDKCAFATDFNAMFCEMYSETESFCLPHQIDPTLLPMINFTSDHWNIHAEFSRFVIAKDPITWRERTSQPFGPVPLWFAAAWLCQLSMLLPDVAVYLSALCLCIQLHLT